MAQPWQDTGHDHDVYETSSGLYKCHNCEKMATAKKKFSKTPCQ